MRKIICLCLSVVLFLSILAACTDNGETSPVDTPTTDSTSLSTTDPGIITVSRPWHDPAFNWDDVSIRFPEELTVRADDQHIFGFQRQFRMGFYGIGIADRIDSVSREVRRDWLLNELEQNVELAEPLYLLFIKRFDITFTEFERAAKELYLFYVELETDRYHEDYEIPNPCLLFTFNVERINDYYSLDPARNASARAWLEEWLQENEPYASYSAFRAANPQ